MEIISESNDIRDPLGNNICIPVQLFRNMPEEQATEIYLNITSVLQKPAMVLETESNQSKEIHYFRLLDNLNTMLVSVKITDDICETFHYICNPANELLFELLRKGRRIM